MPTAKKFVINGAERETEVEAGISLLSLLRDTIGLTGTKYGCGEGDCGACTVLIDGAARRSCRVSADDAAGKKITTIEGLEQDGKLHPVQEAFMKHEAFQCGFCTPGMIMAAVALLQKNSAPTEKEIISGMEQNICRCCTYSNIIAAVSDAAGTAKESAS